MRVVAFLPAKGTSERIQSKNMSLLDGKPLFLHTLEKLVSCDFIDEVFLDSESDEILTYASYLNYTPLKRDPMLATNHTDGHEMFYNEISQVDADIYIQILGTSPFIDVDTIKRGVEILKNNVEYDSVVLVYRDKQYTWRNNAPEYDGERVPNSKDLPETIIETMGLYMVRKETALKEKKRYGQHPYLLEATPLESIDINQPKDLELAQLVASGMRTKEVGWLKTLAIHLSSSVFADLLSEAGIDSCYTGLRLNLENKKIFGRASTLKIRRIREGDNYQDIYKGLQSYQYIRHGEIIVVENEADDLAYFGELNANLAIRSGAAGTIVSGCTRDIQAVTAMDYPVFSRGYSCKDVKGVAVVEAIQKPVKLGDITVCPGDLIFADICGISVIPRCLEKKLVKQALEVIKIESKIVARVLEGEDAFSIYRKEGDF